MLLIIDFENLPLKFIISIFFCQNMEHGFYDLWMGKKERAAPVGIALSLSDLQNYHCLIFKANSNL